MALTKVKHRMIAGFTPKAHHSLSVINAEDAALSRYVLTRNSGSSSGQNVMQGFAVDPYKNELYTSHVTGSETMIVNKFEADGKRTQTAYRWNTTASSDVGHQQLSISWDKSGQRWFWSSTNNNTINSARSVTRFQITDGSGTDLNFSNFEQFQVWDNSVTATASSTAACSLDGRYMVTEYNTPATTTIRVFDLPAMMEGGAGDYSSNYLYEWSFDIAAAQYPLQGIASDGAYVYIFFGNINVGPTLKAFVYTITGELVQEIDDFTVGETTAQGDGAGTEYEMEGAGWVWHGGQPMLACSIASGDAGARRNRIWVLGGNVSVTAYGNGNKPAFISQGGNDLAAPDGEVLRIGHYNGATDTFTEGASINTSNQFEFTPVTGSWTVNAYDASSGGNVSPTSATGEYSKIGNMVFVNFSLSSIDVTGMTGANNLYIRGHGFTPTSATTLSAVSESGFDLTAGYFGIVADIDTNGNIFVRELQDAGSNIIANVSQFSGATVRISGWFMV